MAELRSIYEERLRDRAAREERLRRAATAAEWARNGASALALAVLAFASLTGASPAWLTPPILLFAGSLAARAILELRRERVGRAAAFYREGLARLDGEWTPAPLTGEELAPPDHPYARDLDVIGERSLFTRLCRARTSAGAAALARWLLAPAPPAELRARQAAVRELRDRLDLREALALAGPPGIARIDADALAAWGEGRPTLPWRPLRGPLALASAAVPLGVAGLALGWGPAPLLAALAVAGAAHLALRRRVGAVLGRVLEPAAGLSVVAEAMRLVEGEA